LYLGVVGWKAVDVVKRKYILGFVKLKLCMDW
jgi:hypothetical protein